MALDQSALLKLTEALRTADGGELMRRLLHRMLQAVIDAEATAQIGAAPQERTDACLRTVISCQTGCEAPPATSRPPAAAGRGRGGRRQVPRDAPRPSPDQGSWEPPAGRGL